MQGALLGIRASAGVAWLAFLLFAHLVGHEQGPVEPMPVIVPLNAFFLFPWMVIGVTALLLHAFG